MKKILLGLLVLGSFSVLAEETISNPLLEAKAKFTCNSELDAVCYALGYSEYVDDGKLKCVNFKKLGFLSRYSADQYAVRLGRKSSLVHAVINDLENRRPDNLLGSLISGEYFAITEKYLYINYGGNSKVQVVKRITCR
jgi:hypothetical protein